MTLLPEQINDLVKRCVANDRTAQEKLYRIFYAQMIRLCNRYLSTDELAKDALNTGFLKVFQHIESYRADKGDLGAWIHVIMVRTCIDVARKEEKFGYVPLDLTPNNDVFVEPSVLQKMYAEDLLSHIRQLPNATQLVFNLSVIDGYSHQEIAEKLKISESTSRWHLSEGKKQLRRMLSNNELSNGQSEKTKR